MVLEIRTVANGSKHEGRVAPNMEGLRPRGLRPQDLRPYGRTAYGRTAYGRRAYCLGLMLTVRSVLCGKGEKSLIFFFRSEAPPNLSARAKKNSKGAPSFAERDYRENPHPATRAGENGG